MEIKKEFEFTETSKESTKAFGRDSCIKTRLEYPNSTACFSQTLSSLKSYQNRKKMPPLYLAILLLTD